MKKRTIRRACIAGRKAHRAVKRVIRHHACLAGRQARLTVGQVRRHVQHPWLWATFGCLAGLFIVEIQLGMMGISLNHAGQTLHNNQSTITQSLQQLTRSTEDELNNVRSLAVSTNSQTNQLANELKSRAAKVETLVDSSKEWLMEHTAELARLKNSTNVDRSKMIPEVLLPSVRVKMPDSVGGGTIIYSQADRKGRYHTYVLTACHVIQRLIARDAQGNEVRNEATVEVWREDLGGLDEYRARIVNYHVDKDLALLKLNTDIEFKHVARLIPRNEIDKVAIFTRVYTVGCPLGYDPIPTYGEIAQIKREVNGEKVWLMNAPTIFGNSGGGVFLAETNRFIGLSSRIAVYNHLVSIPVTHLGLIIPPETIYQWLDSQLFQFVYDQTTTKAQCDFMRKRLVRFIPLLQKIHDE